MGIGFGEVKLLPFTFSVPSNLVTGRATAMARSYSRVDEHHSRDSFVQTSDESDLSPRPSVVPLRKQTLNFSLTSRNTDEHQQGSDSFLPLQDQIWSSEGGVDIFGVSEVK